MNLNIGTPNNHHFPFGTNGKVVVLGVPILKHFRVLCIQNECFQSSAHEKQHYMMTLRFLTVHHMTAVANYLTLKAPNTNQQQTTLFFFFFFALLSFEENEA